MNPDDLCPRPQRSPANPTQPLIEPIHLTTVYRCDDPQQADALLAGEQAGYVYRRDDHPNAALLADKCRSLHGAERGAVCASGMAALSCIVLSQLSAGDHIVVSHQLYGRSLRLLTDEAMRLGISSTVVDTSDLEAVATACQTRTKLLFVETITNPTLGVSDLKRLAEIAHRNGALLAVDNTFASPLVCRPMEWGADFVMESLTKIMNGHSDVLLGFVGGREKDWARVPEVISSWGFTANPLECWLAQRGLGTLALRAECASRNALTAARHLEMSDKVTRVHYPGLDSHRDHALASEQFGGRYGAMVTFVVCGGLEGANRFIAAARHISFTPSLGELCTTLSHPLSTSHRAMDDATLQQLGIEGGMIRLSVGIESTDFVQSALDEGLHAV